MAAKIYYQEDCNLSLLEGQKIAIIGMEHPAPRQPGNCVLRQSGCWRRCAATAALPSWGCGDDGILC